METIICEIRAAEGGMDSKLLAKDLADVYRKAARVENFSISTLEEKDGCISLCL
jgi:protein subunit release factor A